MTHHLTATVTREGRWWMIHVPELDKTTQARTLAEATFMARDLVAAILDVDIDTVEVTLRVELPGLDAALHRLATAEQASRAAREEESQARHDVAELLTSLGVSMRDSGIILGLSHQRVAQLLTGHANRPGAAGRTLRAAAAQ
jgi:hypothetical protein